MKFALCEDACVFLTTHVLVEDVSGNCVAIFWLSYSVNGTDLWLGHACSGSRTHCVKDERNYGLGMDVLVIALITR